MSEADSAVETTTTTQEERQHRRIEIFHEFKAQRNAIRTGPEREVLAVLLYVLSQLISIDGPTQGCAKVEEIVRSGY